MSTTSGVTTYKVLGGLAATSILTGAGGAVGGIMAVAAGKTEQEILRDRLIGSAIMALPSTVMGLMVASKPNLASAGYTQAVTSGLGLVLALVGISLPQIMNPPSVSSLKEVRRLGSRVSSSSINTNYVLTPSDNRILA